MADRRMLTKSTLAGTAEFTCRIPGAILHAECGRLGAGPRAQVTFQFWYEGSVFGEQGPERTFRTFRTGAELPEEAVYCISARSDEGVAWHLFELFGEGS